MSPRGLWLHLRALFRKDLADTEMDAELRFHLERQIEDNIRRGMSPNDAREAALRSFGGVKQVKEECRDARGFRPLAEFWQDLRYSVRTLARSKGFTCAVVGTLALGIGAATTIFTILIAIFVPSFSFPNPNTLIYLGTVAKNGGRRFPATVQNYLDWKNENQAFEQLSCYQHVSRAWTNKREPERIGGIQTTANLFRMAEIRPVLGMDFRSDADQSGGGDQVILGHALWQSRYGADAGVVGKKVILDGKPFTVVGVMSSDTGFPSPQIDFWIPWVISEDPTLKDNLGRSASVVGRLRPGLGLDQARAAMTVLARRLAAEAPSTPYFEGVTLTSAPEYEKAHSGRSTGLMLFGTVLFVLLIACANVASLVLARTSARERDLAMRAALGARRGRLVRHLLSESLLLSLLGGAAGTLLAYWGVRIFVLLKTSRVPGPDTPEISAGVLAFALAASILTALIFGLLPALQSSRPDIANAMKQGGLASTSRRGNRMRSALVVTEIACALVLLMGAGLMMRSFVLLHKVDLGFDPQNIITLQFAFGDPGDKDAGRRLVLFLDQLLERVRALPGIRAASAANIVPLDGSTMHAVFTVRSSKTGSRDQRMPVEYIQASDGYFAAMGIPLLKGRAFASTDRPGSPQVAIVSDRLARSAWPGEDPIGKEIQFIDESPRVIIGIAADARYGSLDDDYHPKLYLPFRQSAPAFSFATLIVRTTSDPRNSIPALKREIRALDPNLPIDSIQTSSDLIKHWIVTPRFYLGLFGLFALVSISLAGIGIYGVIAYSMAQRTQEIGLRIALGARPAQVLWLAIGRGLLLSLIGVAIGIAGALALSRFIADLLFGVTPTDFGTLALVALACVVISLFASLLPARRAAKVDPIVALRHE